jgi:hypothetical protein
MGGSTQLQRKKNKINCFIWSSKQKKLHKNIPKIFSSATALAAATSNASLKSSLWPTFCPISECKQHSQHMTVMTLIGLEKT